MAGKNGKTRPFTAVNYSAARLAREKQRREYEQQKKEKLIFALFVVIILVMILFAILIFKKVLGNDDPMDTDTDTETNLTDTNGPADTDTVPLSEGYEDKVYEKDALYAGHLLLIDSSHPYREETLDLKDIYNSRQKHDKPNSRNGYVYSIYPADMTVLLEAETLSALNALADDFYAATGNYDLFVRTTAAYVEGASDEHATGRAVDLSGWAGDDVYYSLDDDAYASDFDWIRENYYKYGFIRRTCESACRLDHAYHFLYVGVPHAYYMHQNELSLEEYVELLRTEHVFNGGTSNLTFTTDEGERYEVYYVSAEGDMVTVPLYINNDSYSVSGDNANGFVVTVKLK